MIPPSSRALTRHSLTLRFTLTLSGPYIPSIRESAPPLQLRSGGTLRTYTTMEMYLFFHFLASCAYANLQPWYLTTFAVAEQLYDALLTWQSVGSIQVTTTSLDFFQQFSPSIVTGTYSTTSSQYMQLTSAIKTFADGFVEIAANYTPSDGGLSEQYDKSTGAPVSAADLTWSYASVLTAGASRASVEPASWGASGLTVPAVCLPNPGPQVSVTFNVNATTQFGGTCARIFWRCTDRWRGDPENIFVTGSVDALQNWSPDTALAMSSANYPIWSSTSHI
jgi:glucoamylase